MKLGRWTAEVFSQPKLKYITGLVPIQGSWRRSWCVPSGTDRCPCWQSAGGEGPPAAPDPSNTARSQLSEWHTWVWKAHTRRLENPPTVRFSCVRLLGNKRRCSRLMQGHTHLIRNLLKTRRYANPALLTRMFSRKPRYSTWCFTLQTGGIPPLEGFAT